MFERPRNGIRSLDSKRLSGDGVPALATGEGHGIDHAVVAPL